MAVLPKAINIPNTILIKILIQFFGDTAKIILSSCGNKTNQAIQSNLEQLKQDKEQIEGSASQISSYYSESWRQSFMTLASKQTC